MGGEWIRLSEETELAWVLQLSMENQLPRARQVVNLPPSINASFTGQHVSCSLCYLFPGAVIPGLTRPTAPSWLQTEEQAFLLASLPSVGKGHPGQPAAFGSGSHVLSVSLLLSLGLSG